MKEPRFVIASLALMSGCLFGGADPDGSLDDVSFGEDAAADVASPSDARNNVIPDVGLPPRDVSNNNETIDVGVPDVPDPPSDWHLPEYAKRIEVTWARNGPAVPDFMVPIDIRAVVPNPFAIVSDDGETLPFEPDGPNAWVKVRDFGSTGRMWLYFDGMGAPPMNNPWPDEYVGVWHLDGLRLERGSSRTSNDLVISSSSTPGVGKVGSGLQIVEGTGTAAGSTGLNGVSFPQGESTVEIWVSSADLAALGRGDLIFDGPDPNRLHYYLQFNVVGQPRMELGIVDESIQTSESEFTSANEFLHIAVVVRESPREIQLFLNGAPQAALALSESWTPNQVPTFGGGWNGAIDEMRVHNVARDAEYFRAVVEAYTPGTFSYSTDQMR